MQLLVGGLTAGANRSQQLRVLLQEQGRAMPTESRSEVEEVFNQVRGVRELICGCMAQNLSKKELPELGSQTMKAYWQAIRPRRRQRA